MKAGLLAVAAAMASGVVASKHNHARHNHAVFHNHQNAPRGLTGYPEATCDCSTVYYTTTGAPTREFGPSALISPSLPPRPLHVLHGVELARGERRKPLERCSY